MVENYFNLGLMTGRTKDTGKIINFTDMAKKPINMEKK